MSQYGSAHSALINLVSGNTSSQSRAYIDLSMYGEGTYIVFNVTGNPNIYASATTSNYISISDGTARAQVAYTEIVCVKSENGFNCLHDNELIGENITRLYIAPTTNGYIGSVILIAVYAGIE